MLRLIKLHLPKSEIYWWLDASLVPLLEHDADLTGILPFERKRWAAPQRWPEIAGSLRQMRDHQFDWAIDLQGLARSSLFAWLANAGRTIGLDNEREGAREGANALYDIFPPRARPGTHAVDRYLAVLPLLGVPVHHNFEWLPRRPEVARQVEEKWNTAGSRWITVLPGGRWDNKRWPAQNFIELIRELRATHDVKFAILGSKDEHSLAEEIAAGDRARCLNLAGQTTLLEMIEWIRLSERVVTNDTGPMHVAAALRRPTVAIFGPTDPHSTGPYGQIQNVLQDTTLECVPCMKQVCTYSDPLACLHHITAPMVADRLQTLGISN